MTLLWNIGKKMSYSKNAIQINKIIAKNDIHYMFGDLSNSSWSTKANFYHYVKKHFLKNL